MSEAPFLTIADASAQMRAGQLSAANLLECCFARVDHYEDRVQAWVFIDRDYARAEAERRDREIENGQWRGPLHGIPLGIKDIIDVFDWPTAAGSRLWKDSIARRDATVVARLRSAGAIILGKTVTTAYAGFDPPTTRNPWDLSRTPGGSSSGSAAALACGMCLGALATQTGGSITRPAAFCGVASCKPTFGRVSGDGVLPFAPSLDHVGVMARCVDDVALLMQTIQGPDPRDAATLDQTTLALFDRFGTTRPCLGRPSELFEAHAEPSTLRFFEMVIRQLREAGAKVVDIALPARFADVTARHRTVMAVEAAAYHGPRLQRHADDYPPNVRQLLEEGLRCPATDYYRAKEHQRQLRDDILPSLSGCDALITPATPGPAPNASTTGDPVFNAPWSYTGLPTVSLPAAFTEAGLPLSIQLVGAPWSEPRLFAVARWCEQRLALERRQPPLS